MLRMLEFSLSGAVEAGEWSYRATVVRQETDDAEVIVDVAAALTENR
jgi:hypothetical protein